jgi:hypothetical protein
MPSSSVTQSNVAKCEFPAKDPKTGMRNMRRIVLVTGLLIVAAGAVVSWRRHGSGNPTPPPPQVTVGTPLQETVAATTDFLGQFWAVDTVQLTGPEAGKALVDYVPAEVVSIYSGCKRISLFLRLPSRFSG